MTHWLYLIGLFIAIGCMMLIDHRFKLAFWIDYKKTIIILIVAVIIFILWDILGISLGIFYDGTSQFMLPTRIFMHFPVEELFFLFLLNYTTLIIYRVVSKRW